MNAIEAYGRLRELGYPGGVADLAVSRAQDRGSWGLSRHILTYAGDYAIIERSQA